MTRLSLKFRLMFLSIVAMITKREIVDSRYGKSGA